MWTIFKVFIEFVAILLLLFLAFWPQGIWIFALLLGIKPISSLEDEVLTTGPPGKSQDSIF